MKMHGQAGEGVVRPSMGWALVVGVAMLLAPQAAAQQECIGGLAPDVIVGDLHQIARKGEVGDITAFSVGTVSCNIGTCWLLWDAAPDVEHPVIGQNMYRLKGGRFEQVGQSWLKHGFTALAQSECATCQNPNRGDRLGVNCSDPYSQQLNGQQSNLGPKSGVNGFSGIHVHPYMQGDQGPTGDSIYKRLQVHNDDLDPDLNGGAEYWVEGQYVTEDDYVAGAAENNASTRKISVFESSPDVFNAAFISGESTEREQVGIKIWAQEDEGVYAVERKIQGLMFLSSKAEANGDGTWHYEYALQNLTSDISAGSFSVPMPTGSPITSAGFHDVDYHSGEIYDGTDWGVTTGAGEVTWATESFTGNPDANALRWGTLYNFRFDSDVPPIEGDAAIGAFTVAVDFATRAIVPRVCNVDGTCDLAERCGCAADCPGVPPDDDLDGLDLCNDCNPQNPSIWAAPGTSSNLLIEKIAGSYLTTWDGPVAAGGISPLRYDLVRTRDVQDWVTDIRCGLPDNPGETFVENPEDPNTTGGILFYVVRTRNDCGVSSSGSDSFAQLRAVAGCP